MNLSEQAVAEFQALYEKHFRTRLSPADARREGLEVMKLIKLIQPKKLSPKKPKKG
jgi:hypothetical protein